MSDNLPALSGGTFPSKLDRQVSRALARINGAALVASHQDQIRVGRVEAAASRGLVAVAQISSLEATLVRAVPHAEGRLRAVADAGTISIAGIVARSGF